MGNADEARTRKNVQQMNFTDRPKSGVVGTIMVVQRVKKEKKKKRKRKEKVIADLYRASR